MAERKRSVREILDDLIEHLIPTVRDAFLVAIEGVTSEVILKDLVQSIQDGDIEQAFRTLGMSSASMRPITAALEAAFERGGVAVGGTFPRMLNTPLGRTVFRFDPRNSRAEAFLRDQSSSLVTRIQEDARVNLRNVVTVGMQEGNNPRTVALDIVGRIDPSTGKRVGGIVGLTQQQELWVRNARRELSNLDPAYFSRLRRDKRFDRVVQQAIKDGKPLTQDQISKLLTNYKNSLLKLRGDTIARTEMIQSLNKSEYEAYKQAVDMGATKSNDVEKIWDNAGDARVRHDHNLVEGQTVELDQPFKMPDGSLMMFPGDISLGAAAKEIISCRCKVRYNVNWLADID